MIQTEINMVSRYAAAELSGALILGAFARSTKNPYLRVQLTQHCHEETKHAWMWTKFLSEHKITVEDSHGRDPFFEYLHSLKDDVALLAAVHVYELRIPFHFPLHRKVSSIDPELRDLIEKIEADEKYHLAWIDQYLTKLQAEGDESVAVAISTAGELEDKVYKGYMEKMKHGDAYTQELAKLIEDNLSEYPYEWKKFTSKN